MRIWSAVSETTSASRAKRSTRTRHRRPNPKTTASRISSSRCRSTASPATMKISLMKLSPMKALPRRKQQQQQLTQPILQPVVAWNASSPLTRPSAFLRAAIKDSPTSAKPSATSNTIPNDPWWWFGYDSSSSSLKSCDAIPLASVFVWIWFILDASSTW